MWYWELNPGPLQEHYMFLTAGSFFIPYLWHVNEKLPSQIQYSLFLVNVCIHVQVEEGAQDVWFLTLGMETWAEVRRQVPIWPIACSSQQPSWFAAIDGCGFSLLFQ